MTDPSEYTFRKVTLADADLLQRWRAAPHVRAWWAPSPPYSAAQLDDPDVDRWIVSMGERPFGFIQDYTVHGAAEHHFAHLPAGARGIDQFIGEAELLGQGHGPGFIRARMMALFNAGTPVIATDPHPDNHRAIAAYRKLGFRVTGPAQETQWGLILPMMATSGEVR